MASEVLATNVVIKIDGKVFGCASSASFSTKFAMVSVPCQANGAFSKSINSPWDKQTLTGRVKTTIVSGKVVYQNGKMV